jgi:hypothetical protein
VIAGAGEVSSYLGRSWPCPAGDPGIVASMQRTGQPLRIDDYTQIRSAIAAPARELDTGMAAGVPVLVSGRVWGAVVVAAGYERPSLPADALDRLAVFTELVATAIANSDARAEIERLAGEQAALRRVATLGEQEAAGFGFVMWEGVRQHHAEADLLYFAGICMTRRRVIRWCWWRLRHRARGLMPDLARLAAMPSGSSLPTTS